MAANAWQGHLDRPDAGRKRNKVRRWLHKEPKDFRTPTGIAAAGVLAEEERRQAAAAAAATAPAAPPAPSAAASADPMVFKQGFLFGVGFAAGWYARNAAAADGERLS